MFCLFKCCRKRQSSPRSKYIRMRIVDAGGADDLCECRCVYNGCGCCGENNDELPVKSGCSGYR